MKIYLYLDTLEFDDSAEQIKQAISKWLEEGDQNTELLDLQEGDSPQHCLGLLLETNKKTALKEPLNFLNGLAKEYKCDFAVAIMGDENNPDDVCFFGYEEGRPDLFEIGCYLGLKR